MESNASLLSRIRNGDRSAYEELLRQKDGQLYRIALGITRDSAAAEDAVYDTYERLITHADRIKDPNALDSWLISTVKNRSIDYLRKNARLVNIDVSGLSERAADDRDGSERALIDRCIASLPELQARVLIMYSEGMKLREIAADIAKSTTAAWLILNKAKKNFIRIYNKQ